MLHWTITSFRPSVDIYHFKNHSPIEKIEFVQDAKEVWSARIFPQPGARAEQLSSLTTILNQRQDGIVAVPQSEKGVHTLYASGFATPEHLLNHIAELGYTKGDYTFEKLSKEEQIYSEQLRKASLKLAGYFYLMSDAAMCAVGIMSGRPREAIAGLAYSAGGVVLARYGHKDSHAHLKELSLKLGDYFTREGIAIPKDGPISGANRERSHPIVEGLEGFLYRYPSQVFNAIVAYCGWQLIHSGLENRKHGTGVAGGLVLGGALAGLMIPETNGQVRMKPEEDPSQKKSSNIFTRAYDWMRERPLRVPGLLWAVNNFAYLGTAINTHRKGLDKSYIPGYIYFATALAANALMYVSSKDDSKRFDLDAESTQALIGIAANVIQQQPRELQDKMIEQVAGFISSEGGINCPSEEIARHLRAQLLDLENNPFNPGHDAPVINPPKAPSPCDAEPPVETQEGSKAAKYGKPAKKPDNWSATITAGEDPLPHNVTSSR